MNNYTDTKLKAALSKMLPDKTAGLDEHGTLKWYSQPNGYYFYEPVLDTELLHLCWMVASQLTIFDYARHENELCKAVDSSGADSDIWHHVLNASWQQRVVALCKVKGVEI